MAQSMMKAKGMPARFWGEAMTTAVFILNHALTKALTGKMPFEAWYGCKASVSFLRTFGCIGHVKKTKLILTKLEDRSTPMVLLGYEEGTKAYQLYDPREGKVVVSRDVVFDKTGTIRARGKLAASPAPSSSSTWSSTVVETLEWCRPLQQQSRALLGRC